MYKKNDPPKKKYKKTIEPIKRMKKTIEPIERTPFKKNTKATEKSKDEPSVSIKMKPKGRKRTIVKY